MIIRTSIVAGSLGLSVGLRLGPVLALGLTPVRCVMVECNIYVTSQYGERPS
jgi:hypothetical protein